MNILYTIQFTIVVCAEPETGLFDEFTYKNKMVDYDSIIACSVVCLCRLFEGH